MRFPFSPAAAVVALVLGLATTATARDPIGAIDRSVPGRVAGWALDPDTPRAAIAIHVYVDRPAGQGSLVAAGQATLPRPDVTQATGLPGDHGYSIQLPASVGRGRKLYVYAIDTAGGQNPALPPSQSGADVVGGGAPAAGPAPGSTGGAPSPTAGLKRGLRWVRSNPMFISGLVTRMPSPPRAVVNQYFGRFHANAVHLWADGMGPRIVSWLDARPGSRFVSWLMQNGASSTTGTILGGRPNLPGRIGYQIGDEPASLADLQTYQRGIDAVRATDPGALIIGNFSYTASQVDAQLQHFATRMQGDVISYDLYTRRSGSYKALHSFRAAALRHGLPYWRYIYGYIDNRGAPSESDMRWDAFMGLTFGYTGHTWFLYQIPPNTEGLRPLFFQQAGGWNVPSTPKLDVAGQINVELAHLGRAITQLTSTDVRYVPGLFRKPSAMTKWRRGAGNDPYLVDVSASRRVDLAVGFFQDGRGDHYLMVQNANHAQATWPANRVKSTTARLTFDFDGSPDPSLDRNTVQQLNRLTGQVENLPLSSVGGGRKRLSVHLEAGNPVLIKYKTARPFALR